MGIYSIGHLTKRCNGWMACYSQTFTETFCEINFVCCTLWMLTYKRKEVFYKHLNNSYDNCDEAVLWIMKSHIPTINYSNNKRLMELLNASL